MKKKFLTGVCAIVLLAVTGYGVNQSMKNEADLSKIALLNVEALAQGESGGGKGCTTGKGYCAIYVNGELFFSSNKHVPYN